MLPTETLSTLRLTFGDPPQTFGDPPQTFGGALRRFGAGITQALIGGELATELLAVAAKVPAALLLHSKAKDLEKELERLYEQRDKVVAEALPLVQRGSKTLQGNLGKTNLRDMGDYGYTVNDTPIVKR